MPPRSGGNLTQCGDCRGGSASGPLRLTLPKLAEERRKAGHNAHAQDLLNKYIEFPIQPVASLDSGLVVHSLLLAATAKPIQGTA